MSNLSPLSQNLLQFSSICVPDVPLPLKLLRNTLKLKPMQFQQAQDELILHQCWVNVPGIGILLPVAVWAELAETTTHEQRRSLLQSAVQQAQAAMSLHSRLSQLAAIREMGPHLLIFAEQTESMALPESSTLWQVLGTYLQTVGKSSEAAACFQKALKSTAVPIAADWQMGVYQQLGEAYRSQQAFSDAEASFQNAITLCTEAFGVADARHAALIDQLGQLAFIQNDFCTALRHYQHALAIETNAQSGDNRIASRWNNLGKVHQAAGDLNAAVDCFQKAAALWQHAGTSEHHVNQALALKNLGMAYQQLGRLEDARVCLEQAIQLSEAFYGKDHPDIGRDANLLAGILQQMGLLTQALPFFQRALQIDTHAFGRLHPEVALTLNNLGTLLYEMGNIDDARAAFEEALTILQQCASQDHPYRQQVEENLHSGLHSTSNSIQ